MAIRQTNPLKILANDPTSFLLHGEPKVGKTTLAGTFPAPAFVSAPGDEALSLAALPNAGSIKIYQVEDWKDYCSALLGLCKKEASDGLRTVVVDTVSHAYTFAVEAVVADQTRKIISQATWTEANRRFLEVLDNAARLNYSTGKNFVVLAHSRVVVMGEEPNQYTKTGADLGDRLKGKFYGRFNTIFHLRMTGTNKRELLMKPTANIDVGSRYRFKENLENPTGEAIMNIIQTYKQKIEADNASGT